MNPVQPALAADTIERAPRPACETATGHTGSPRVRDKTDFAADIFASWIAGESSIRVAADE